MKSMNVGMNEMMDYYIDGGMNGQIDEWMNG